MKWRFSELRVRHGLTQEGFRKEFNTQFRHKYTPSAISLFENGKRLPALPVLLEIAEFFDVSLDYLLGREDDKDMKGVSLSPLEKLHVRKYRSLSASGKAIVDATLEAIFQQEYPLQKNSYEKRGTS